MTHLSHSFFRIVEPSCIHRLQLGFINVFIASIRFICFITLNIIHLCRSVRDVVLLKWCTKWATNESDFCPFLSRHCRSEKWPSILFLEFLLSVTYINSVTHAAFYFIDYTSWMAFIFVDTFSVDFRGDLFQPKTDLFSTRALISVNFKTMRYFFQPIFRIFSY